MRLRSVLLLVGLAVAIVLRRRSAGSGERVDVFFDDGSMLRLERGPEAADLLDDAREILAAAAP